MPEARDKLARAAALRQVDREWAWGGATGAGVKVAIIDSGVEGSHPVVGGRLVQSVQVQIVDDEHKRGRRPKRVSQGFEETQPLPALEMLLRSGDVRSRGNDFGTEPCNVAQ